MSTPATGDEFLELVVQSTLLTHDQLEPYARSGLGAGADGPRLLAERLVEDGLLTPFQTRQLLAGKVRGYFLADNKYKALGPLGTGLLGPVVLCEDTRLRQRVAVKLLQRVPDKESGKLGALERFVREALVVGTLNHPNLVRVFGLEWSGKMPCLVMEHVEGPTLRQFVADSGPLAVPQAVQFIRQAAAGLQYAHSKRLLHREVRPGHMIVDATGAVRVTGFGLGHFFRSPSRAGTDPSDPLLAAMADFMAPEQATGTADGRSDVYSLGATLYFLLTGRAPFETESVSEKVTGHQFRQPAPLRELRPDVSYGLVEVIGHMMAKNPHERYQTVNDAAVALGQWGRDPVAKTTKTAAAAPVAPPPARREPVLPPLTSAPKPGSGGSWGAMPAPVRPAPKPTPPPASPYDTATSSEADTPRDTKAAFARSAPPGLSASDFEPELDVPKRARPPARPEPEEPGPELDDPEMEAEERAAPAPRSSRPAPVAGAPGAAAHPPSATTATIPPPPGVKAARRLPALIAGVLVGGLAIGGVVVALIATNAFAPTVPTMRAPGTAGPAVPPDQSKQPNPPPPPVKPPDKKTPDPVAPAPGVQITGSGSTFVKPAMEYWTRLYEQKTGVVIKYDGIGSGRGIENMMDKVLEFGCTDAPMTTDQLKKAKDTYGDVLHVPLAMGAVVVMYNLPDVKQQLRFTGPVLADVYLGKITRWNHEALAASNPGVALPDMEIAVVRRSDSSGTTAIWTEYLSKVSPEWKTTVGTGTTVTWPKGVGAGADKSNGVAKAVGQKVGAIGYVELSFALERNLKYGQVKNRAEKYVQPSLESVTAAANASLQDIPVDLRYALTDPPGEESYPIAGTTWLIVYADQSAAKKKGKELVKFLRWAVEDGQAHLKELRYAPLPPTMVARVKEKIAAIQTSE